MILVLRVLLAQGGARGQNLFFFCLYSFMEAVVDELVTIVG